MAGVMAISGDTMSNRIETIKYGAADDVAAKLDQLRRLRGEVLDDGSELGLELLTLVFGLLSDTSSPVRKYIMRMIGEIGQKHLELLPEIVPVLMDVMKDATPAVSRQAIMCGTNVFRGCFIKVAIQGMQSSGICEPLKLSWESVLKLKDELYSIAFGVGNEGTRLCALKFVESVVLLYTSDPDGPLEPISQDSYDEFDISWLRGGHPVLNVSELSAEASRCLSRLIDLLRTPSVKSDSFLVIIVLIKSISIVAKKRPAFYGRILPVLLAFKPLISENNTLHIAGVHHALKNAFESCLDCEHQAAAPWRNRLVSALSGMKVEDFIEKPTTEKAEVKDEAHAAQIREDAKPSTPLSPDHDNVGRKRSASLDKPDLAEDDMAGKRARSVFSHSEGLGDGMSEEQERKPSHETSPSHSNEDNGPVQQLVAMFGALVAQGEKAVASLQILISSISADLLAEVVMANMQNIPPKSFKIEGAETSILEIGAEVDVADTHIKHLSRLLSDVLPQSMTVWEPGIEQSHHSFKQPTHADNEPEGTMDDSNATLSSLNFSSEQVEAPSSESVSVDDVPFNMETGHVSIAVEANDMEDVSNEIPGLVSSIQNEEVPELASSNSFAGLDDSDLTKLIDGPQEDNPVLGGIPPESYLLTSDRSEELSSKAEMMDSASGGLPVTYDAPVSRLVLPKISAPVIYLSDEQKDQLQQLAFLHIIDAYRQVSIAGGSEIRFSILAHSGMEFPSELDPWKILKEHIFSDYSNHEGHELTLRVLYRLYGEAEADRDFFSSTTATSVYETFLLQVAETLRDSFPASDKSLGRLLCDVPYLPKSIYEMLESLSCPGNAGSDDKELSGDRVTQGLSVVWSLILQRPPVRSSCLRIALKSAVHHMEEVRMKAIRLVANKLYPLSSISRDIEDFARDKMVSAITDNKIGLPTEADQIHVEPQESGGFAVKDISPESHQLPASEGTPSSALAEVQRYMSLYFALCTKKHSLFWNVFDVYKDTSTVAKQAISQKIPLLVRTISSSHDLLNILSDPPPGSDGLVIQVVQTLTDGLLPPSELVLTIKRLYDKKLKNVDILIPILPFLPRDEILVLFPHLVSSSLDKFQIALSRIVQGFNQSAAVLTPAEAVIAIHGIDPERDGIPLKKVTDACNVCFEQRHIFSQQVLAKVLNQLVEQIPLPLLFMRTVLQAVGAFPTLMEFIVEILSRLVNKQIWKYPKLWVGFLKCAQVTKPQSFSVLIQLPTAQLENALSRIPAIKDPLVAHAAQPHIRSSLPRSILVVLGLETQVAETTATEIQTEIETRTETQTTEAGDPEEEESATDTVKDEESSVGV